MENPSRDFALPVLSSEGSGRREVVRSFGTLSAALLAALGLREVAAKRGPATGERHRNGEGHPHGKRGKRGKAGPGGSPGSPGSPGGKGEKGDNGGQGETGPQGAQGPGKTMLTGTTSWNPGRLTPGESSSTMVEVPGAAEGDPVMASLSSIGQFSIEIWAMPIYGYVKFEGFVAVTITNLSNNSTEIVRDGTLTVVVVKA